MIHEWCFLLEPSSVRNYLGLRAFFHFRVISLAGQLRQEPRERTIITRKKSQALVCTQFAACNYSIVFFFFRQIELVNVFHLQFVSGEFVISSSFFFFNKVELISMKVGISEMK